MKLCEHLSKDAIILGVKGQQKEAAIAEVAGRLPDHPAVADYDGFLSAVYEREKAGSTGVGNGVAIPHARTDSVSGFVAALGTHPDGLEFGAIDGKPVKLIIVMGIPSEQVKAYLRLLAHLSLLLKQPEFVDRVLKAASEQDVIDALAEHEA